MLQYISRKCTSVAHRGGVEGGGEAEYPPSPMNINYPPSQKDPPSKLAEIPSLPTALNSTVCTYKISTTSLSGTISLHLQENYSLLSTRPGGTRHGSSKYNVIAHGGGTSAQTLRKVTHKSSDAPARKYVKFY